MVDVYLINDWSNRHPSNSIALSCVCVYLLLLRLSCCYYLELRVPVYLTLVTTTPSIAPTSKYANIITICGWRVWPSIERGKHKSAHFWLLWSSICLEKNPLYIHVHMRVSVTCLWIEEDLMYVQVHVHVHVCQACKPWSSSYCKATHTHTFYTCMCVCVFIFIPCIYFEAETWLRYSICALPISDQTR